MALSKVNPNFLNVSQVGGRRNLIINGDHQVQQRGTTFATSGSDRFASDRWALNPIGGSPCSASIQFDSTLQKNTLKVTKETSTGDIQIVNKIEGFKQFHNKQFTLSYYVRANTSRNLYIGSGFYSASGFTSIDTTTVPATTQWQRFTRTFSSTDLSGYTENNSSWLRLEFRIGDGVTNVNPADYIEFTDVQIELGDQDTPFEHRSYGEELELCKRYYQLVESASGMSANTTVAQFNVPFSPEMRNSPSVSISDVNGLACARITDHAYADTTITSGATILLSNVSKYGARTQISGFSGLTQGRFVGFLPGGSYSSFMRFDAEL